MVMEYGIIKLKVIEGFVIDLLNLKMDKGD